MDLLNQFETILNKSIKRVVEERNRKRKLAAPYNRVFYWDGYFIMYPLLDEGLVIDIQVKEETEDMYGSNVFYVHIPVKTLLDETLLEDYLDKVS